jgi:two-component system, NarL family, nitrate/nitrite response regulator NarL
MGEPADRGRVDDRLGASSMTVAVIADEGGVGDMVEALLASETPFRPIRVRSAASLGALWADGSRHVVVLCPTPLRAREASEEVARKLPDARTVIVVPPGANGILAAGPGIHALVLADRLQEALAPTISAVLAGQLVFPRSSHRDGAHASLSRREHEVLRLATQGWSDSQIATRLSVARTTVKAHLNSAFAKLAAQPAESFADLPAKPTILAASGEESGVGP